MRRARYAFRLRSFVLNRRCNVTGATCTFVCRDGELSFFWSELMKIKFFLCEGRKRISLKLLLYRSDTRITLLKWSPFNFYGTSVERFPINSVTRPVKESKPVPRGPSKKRSTRFCTPITPFFISPLARKMSRNKNVDVDWSNNNDASFSSAALSRNAALATSFLDNRLFSYPHD